MIDVLRKLSNIGISYDKTFTRFCKNEDLNIEKISEELEFPISVIFQITRKCHLCCIFCSEPEEIPDPEFKYLIKAYNNLKGTARVFLSGGEPSMRKDLADIIELFSKSYIIGLPTNALIPKTLIPVIKEKVNFVNVGLDGPRNITNRIRGDYDKILEGIRLLRINDISISLTSVILSSTLDSIPFMCQIADDLGAIKHKLVLPIQKGRALELRDTEFISEEKVKELYRELQVLKEKMGWKPIITLTPWTNDVEGYSILIYPDGNTYAWPVYDKDNKRLYLGNIFEENIKTIWEKYPYKANHLKKYLGKSIYII